MVRMFVCVKNMLALMISYRQSFLGRPLEQDLSVLERLTFLARWFFVGESEEKWCSRRIQYKELRKWGLKSKLGNTTKWVWTLGQGIKSSSSLGLDFIWEGKKGEKRIKWSLPSLVPQNIYDVKILAWSWLLVFLWKRTWSGVWAGISQHCGH